MKSALHISIGVNFVLLAALIFPASGLRNSDTGRAVSSMLGPRAVPAVGSALQADPTSETRVFSWADVESSDYRKYIDNLRAIGCPELTIRDIITADVRSLYKQRRASLERKQGWGGTTSLGRSPRDTIQMQLRALGVEEASVLTALVGNESQAEEITSDAPVRQKRTDSVDLPVSKPLVLQEVDPATLQLNPAQLEAISELRQQFIDEVGGPN